MWIGRSSSWARSIATSVATPSAIKRDKQGQPQRRAKILPDEHRRDTDANRSEVRRAQPQRLQYLVCTTFLGVDRAQLSQGISGQQLVQVAAWREALSLTAGIGVRDDDPRCIEDGRIGDVLRVDARLENRAQAGIVAQRRIGIGLTADHLPRAMVDGIGQQIAARLALLETHAGEQGEIDHAQHDDHEHDERRDASDLLALDA